MTTYVNWKSASGKTGVDTLESFNEWSNVEGAKGKFKKVKTFESAEAPEGYKPRKTKEQIREERKQQANPIKEEKTSPQIGENKSTIPTPPEAIAKATPIKEDVNLDEEF
jgi:hypothetical protein